MIDKEEAVEFIEKQDMIIENLTQLVCDLTYRSLPLKTPNRLEHMNSVMDATTSILVLIKKESCQHGPDDESWIGYSTPAKQSHAWDRLACALKKARADWKKTE